MAKVPPRFHLVLVPGFGGFDALGKIEYYAGVTELFKVWNRGKHAVLHYFDNLPTAAVVTRASRLQSYLAKRMARGEIAPDDKVTLLGHSTGGLDIRQLLSNLNRDTEAKVHIDGAVPMSGADVLGCIWRVVFLSVPHWGTNIADWVRSQRVLRRAAVTKLQVAVAGSRVFLLDQLEASAAGAVARITGADLPLALEDALTEANECNGERTPQRIAEAHEASAELNLYVRDIASDFSVIDDLTSRVPPGGPTSPAHYGESQRQEELRQWQKKVTVLSYATVSRSPFRFPSDAPAPVWELTNPCTCPEIAKDPALSAGTDVFYRMCYRACAGGPFRQPEGIGKITRYQNGAPRRPLELWDNDGIVNTLSMLWPGRNTLVAGDHLDIVGHYVTREAVGRGNTRGHRSYDLLRSMPPFGDAEFSRIWEEIFEFSVGRAVAAQLAAR